MKTVDVTGQRFARLLVLEKLPRYGLHKFTHYRCRCDCGNTHIVEYRKLQNGDTKSCGCLRKEAYHKRRASDEVLYINRRWASYRDKAKRRGLDWELRKTEFSTLLLGNCHYCGLKNPSGFVGVDRVDSSVGYLLSNCVPACPQCNFAKSDTDYKDFTEWIERVHAYLVHQ